MTTPEMKTAIHAEQAAYDQYRKLSAAFCNTQTDIKIGASKMILDARYDQHCAISAALQVWFDASDVLEKLRDTKESEKAEAFKRELAKIQTYVIHIPDCSGSYARFDFEAGEWWSTNNLAEAWTTEQLSADEAEQCFRDPFGILQHDWLRASVMGDAVDENAAAALIDLKWKSAGASMRIIGCSPYASGDLIIPAEINGLPVTSINEYAFIWCSGLVNVTIPNTVTHIGEYAFSTCTGLKSVTIPSSVTDIGDYAFRECRSLTNITIPSSVKQVGKWTFLGCHKLKTVTIPSGTPPVDQYA